MNQQLYFYPRVGLQQKMSQVGSVSQARNCQTYLTTWCWREKISTRSTEWLYGRFTRYVKWSICSITRHAENYWEMEIYINLAAWSCKILGSIVFISLFATWMSITITSQTLSHPKNKQTNKRKGLTQQQSNIAVHIVAFRQKWSIHVDNNLKISDSKITTKWSYWA